MSTLLPSQPNRPKSAALAGQQNRAIKRPQFGSGAHFSSAASGVSPQPPEEYAFWRDSPARYGGYADEIGEFLSPYLGGLGKFMGYGISTGYCLADVFLDTLPKKFKKGTENNLPFGKKVWKTMEEFMDLSFFHVFATLLIPPKIIGMVVELTDAVLDKDKLAEMVKHAKDSKGVASWIAEPSAALAKVLHDQVGGKKYAEFIENQFGGKGQWVAESVKPRIDQVIKRFGKPISEFLKTMADLAKFYEKHMPWDWLKDKKLEGSLLKNASDFESGIVKKSLNSSRLAQLLFVKPIPVLIGIGMVGLIAHPFDKLMLKFQDWTLRPLLGKNKIVKENGHLKSIRNPEFWGDKPKPVHFAARYPLVNPVTNPFMNSSARPFPSQSSAHYPLPPLSAYPPLKAPMPYHPAVPSQPTPYPLYNL